MEKRTLELEIVKIWWMWRGCLQDYYDGYDTETITDIRTDQDPMDRRDYKEACAFPMQKPNFDVFGIPRRTRAQRGWYQVYIHPKSRPTHRTCILPTPQSSSDAPSTGADVPVEIVRLIGEMMCKRLSWLKDDDKRTMATCALVCRHWAGHFLPRIFRKVTIRSRQRALELYKFDCSAGSACWFHRFVAPQVKVQIRSLSELSCVHLLTRHMKKSVHLTGPLPRGWKTLRSVHQALPRTVPRSFSSNIRELRLTGIHFQCFLDFVHLVCELPHLEFLFCWKLKWGSLPQTINIRPRQRRTQNLYDHLVITMDSDMWTRASVHIFTHILSRGECPFFTPGAVIALVSLVDYMSYAGPKPDHNNHDSLNSHTFSGQWTASTSLGCCFQFDCGTAGVPHFRVYIQGAQAPYTSANGGIEVSEVTDVTLDLGVASDGQNTWWKTFDWHELDRQISLLNPTRLVLGFTSRDCMLAFGDEVADPLMPCASARGTIRYAMGDKWDRDKWYKASRDSDVLQGPPTHLDSLYSE